jgi:dolichol kinase
MVTQAVYPGIVIVIVLTGLQLANFLHDRGVEKAISRYLAAWVGGLAFLVAILLLDRWVAITIGVFLALLTAAVKLRFASLVRGTEGNTPGQSLSEVSFAASGAACLFVGWGLMSDPVLAFVPIAFMAWGDSSAGVVRWTLLRRRPDSILASCAMFLACSLIGVVVFPVGVALLAASCATLIERVRLVVHNGFDDNWLVAGSCLIVLIAV